MIRTFVLAIGLLLAASAPAATELPGDSVYRLTDTYVDQDGRAFRLADGRGKVRLATMFYTSCPYICPLIIDSAKGVEHALTPAERSRLAFLLVSLDPARDDPAALKRIADKRKLDPKHWTLARTEAAGVRRTAAVLGIRYRALADGEFNHSSALVLLDGEGRVLARTEQLGTVPDPTFLAAVRAALAGPAGSSLPN
ncbi:SCO family protein [Arenimonas daejeonensis]|uniref:SCO family protein n=1 Tax=Arenimonas daejeonensis TaxID=370777 RepID=UPI0011BD8D58|nr:SCO family protein [Arenimonas daejeonensis]